MRKVILMFEGRTGSSLLIGLLNQCTGLCFAGEEMAGHKPGGWAAQHEWLQAFFQLDVPFPDRDRRARNEPIGVLGFKIKLRDLADPAAFARYLADQDCHIVRLRRENPVKQALSALRAMDLQARHGLYNLSPGESHKTPGAYAIPLDRFDQVVTRYQRFEANLDAYLSRNGLNPVMTITYEALMADMSAEVSRFCAQFCTPAPRKLEARLIKLTDDDMSRVVDNYAELRDRYQDSPLARYFD